MELKVKFRYKEAVADILNESDLIARSVETAENTVTAENVKANVEELSITKILRHIQSAMSQVLAVLQPYRPVWGYKDVDGEYKSVIDGDNLLRLYEGKNNDGNSIDMDNVFVYLRELPSNFDVSVKDSIATEIHNFVVNYTMERWLASVLPDRAELYAMKENASNANLIALHHSRTKPSRK